MQSELEKAAIETTPPLFRPGDICLIDPDALIRHSKTIIADEIIYLGKKVQILGQNKFGRFIVEELGNHQNKFTVDARLLVLLKGVEERELTNLKSSPHYSENIQSS